MREQDPLNVVESVGNTGTGQQLDSDGYIGVTHVVIQDFVKVHVLTIFWKVE